MQTCLQSTNGTPSELQGLGRAEVTEAASHKESEPGNCQYLGEQISKICGSANLAAYDLAGRDEFSSEEMTTLHMF